MITELTALQLLRLKGRTTREALATCLGDPDTDTEIDGVLDALIAAGTVTDTNGKLKTTADGRARLAELLTAERSEIDSVALDEAYHEFDVHNTDLKALMTRWQLIDDTTPNDHSDADYDAAVIADLLVLDRRFRPLLATMVNLVPRFAHYPRRFSSVIENLRAGDHSWFARPIADSYHTVWFELHEDLISATGRTRLAEAVAGRAL